MSAAPSFAPYPHDLRDEVDAYLRDLTFSREPEVGGLVDAMRHSLLAGGKRLRPVIALATCDALGGDRRAVMPLAAALELVHTFSLIHDDLPAMDNSDVRRGRPTCHRMFGEHNHRRTFVTESGIDGARDAARDITGRAVERLRALRHDTATLEAIAYDVLGRAG